MQPEIMHQIYQKTIFIQFIFLTLWWLNPTLYNHFFLENNDDNREITAEPNKLKQRIILIFLVFLIILMLSSLFMIDSFLYKAIVLYSLYIQVISYYFYFSFLLKAITGKGRDLEIRNVVNGLFQINILAIWIITIGKIEPDISVFYSLGHLSLNDFSISLFYVIYHATFFFLIVSNIVIILYNSSIYINHKLTDRKKDNKSNQFSYKKITNVIKTKQDKYYKKYNQVTVPKKQVELIKYSNLVIFEYIYETILPSILFPFRRGSKNLNKIHTWFINLHNIDLISILYFNARVSIIYSVAFSYIVFQYYTIISDSGIIIFEFIATIFLLPFIFNELRNFKTNKDKD
ncbi:hypothetical protein [Aerococcus viridans]|uniref:hypothetical protein n=1 Tax=Aerococcus viridans TaxID=1377 RepID=UPI00031CC6A9|nr:hypothetical protein [Aerococcus viridans]